MCDDSFVSYEIRTTNVFDKWLSGVKNVQHRARVISRLDRVQYGHFGDHKSIGSNLFELRFFFGSGFRVYYTIQNGIVVLLLCGGNKSTQSRDIKKACDMIDLLE